MGYPWAGQLILMEVDDFAILTSIEVDDSFGNDEPIGSKIIYLKVGTGNPWAGQLRARDWPPKLLNPVVAKLEGNLGADDPTAPKIFMKT